MRHQELTYNLLGQSFLYDPPEGRPSGTPTVQVFAATNDDDGGVTETAAAACTVDAVNTTLTTAADRGTKTLEVTSGTSIARARRYLLEAVNGQRELVDVMTISGTTVGLRRPLSNTYAAGATFVGARIAAAVNSTWVATKAKLTDVLLTTWRTDQEGDTDWPAGGAGYRLRWAYTVGGVATIGVSYADLVRYPAKNLVTPADVDDKFAGWIDRLPTDHQVDQGAALIAEAFAAIRMDALGDAQVLRRIRDTQVIHELTIHKAVVVGLEDAALNGADNAAELKVARELYTQRYLQLIREPKVPIDQTGGGANASGHRLPVWRR